MPSTAYLADIRQRVRIGSEKLDGELADLIRAARSDLRLAGVIPKRVTDEADPTVKLAVATFVKAEFGLENDDAERYRVAYEQVKMKMLLSDRYTKEA